jgi:hypothetical protein
MVLVLSFVAYTRVLLEKKKDEASCMCAVKQVGHPIPYVQCVVIRSNSGQIGHAISLTAKIIYYLRRTEL